MGVNNPGVKNPGIKNLGIKNPGMIILVGENPGRNNPKGDFLVLLWGWKIGEWVGMRVNNPPSILTTIRLTTGRLLSSNQAYNSVSLMMPRGASLSDGFTPNFCRNCKRSRFLSHTMLLHLENLLHLGCRTLSNL